MDLLYYCSKWLVAKFHVTDVDNIERLQCALHLVSYKIYGSVVISGFNGQLQHGFVTWSATDMETSHAL
jgi:hypothetical protein